MQSNDAHEHDQPRLEIYAFQKGIFIWPLVPLWPILFLLFQLGVSQELLGWCHWIVMALVILTLTVDINLKKALVLLLVVVLCIVLGILAQMKDLPIFASLYGFFESFHLQFDSGLVGLWSVFAGVICLIVYLRARTMGRCIFTPNNLLFLTLGSQDETEERAGKTLRISYEDMLKLLFGLAGTIYILDARSKAVVRRIEYVFFLPFKSKKLLQIWGTREVSVE